MKQPTASRSAALAAALALLGTAEAQAGGVDCRRIPVYSAPCFSQPKPHAGCEPIPYAKAPCFTVHGILQGSNGVPAVRLWRSGTKRVHSGWPKCSGSWLCRGAP